MINNPTPYPENNDLVMRLLRDEEGVKAKLYRDSFGTRHIGIGHNCDIQQTPEELEAMGLRSQHDITDDLTLSEEQIEALFNIDVQDAIDEIAHIISEDELYAMGETRRAVILSMVFQLGGGGFRKFKNFIISVKADDWETAANEMMDSLAARQTPQRWERASEALRVGYFAGYNPPKQKVAIKAPGDIRDRLQTQNARTVHADTAEAAITSLNQISELLTDIANTLEEDLKG